ncbi:hypothetical protein BAE44_0007795 [Dichanthelium oligosanthes]|uniref:Uncharacterized protein n=1 Tax=Dichanthelium oligosanthes TaxID=888268 RepID=A0A1E5W1A5_9POAL|nr:hypothetical protein BAE44_0007795 [Dichanthelium oligosanthes]
MKLGMTVSFFNIGSPAFSTTIEQSRRKHHKRYCNLHIHQQGYKRVSCSASNSGSSVVTSLILSGYGLSNSTVLAYICHLATLQALDLSRNSISDLQDRFFTPDCSLKAILMALNLSSNQLAGEVPDEFLKLTKLHTFLLSGNCLSGTIPRSLSNVTALSRFAANQNNFTGFIPTGITKHLNNLDLSYNRLSDTLSGLASMGLLN